MSFAGCGLSGLIFTGSGAARLSATNTTTSAISINGTNVATFPTVSSTSSCFSYSAGTFTCLCSGVYSVTASVGVVAPANTSLWLYITRSWSPFSTSVGLTSGAQNYNSSGVTIATVTRDVYIPSGAYFSITPSALSTVSATYSGNASDNFINITLLTPSEFPVAGSGSSLAIPDNYTFVYLSSSPILTNGGLLVFNATLFSSASVSYSGGVFTFNYEGFYLIKCVLGGAAFPSTAGNNTFYLTATCSSANFGPLQGPSADPYLNGWFGQVWCSLYGGGNMSAGDTLSLNTVITNANGTTYGNGSSSSDFSSLSIVYLGPRR